MPSLPASTWTGRSPGPQRPARRGHTRGFKAMLQVKEPTLHDKIAARQAVVGICGLGYVGLPLALTFGEKGFPVIGFDIDQRKIDAIAKGQSYIKHIAAERIAQAIQGEKPFAATMDFRKAALADALIL